MDITVVHHGDTQEDFEKLACMNGQDTVSDVERLVEHEVDAARRSSASENPPDEEEEEEEESSFASDDGSEDPDEEQAQSPEKGAPALGDESSGANMDFQLIGEQTESATPATVPAPGTPHAAETARTHPQHSPSVGDASPYRRQSTAVPARPAAYGLDFLTARRRTSGNTSLQSQGVSARSLAGRSGRQSAASKRFGWAKQKAASIGPGAGTAGGAALFNSKLKRLETMLIQLAGPGGDPADAGRAHFAEAARRLSTADYMNGALGQQSTLRALHPHRKSAPPLSTSHRPSGSSSAGQGLSDSPGKVPPAPAELKRRLADERRSAFGARKSISLEKPPARALAVDGGGLLNKDKATTPDPDQQADAVNPAQGRMKTEENVGFHSDVSPHALDTSKLEQEDSGSCRLPTSSNPNRSGSNERPTSKPSPGRLGEDKFESSSKVEPDEHAL